MSSSSHIGAILPAVLGLGLAAASAGYAQLPAIPTAREPVTNIYHGVAVVDDYQWLEDAANPAVRDWTRQQNERTRAYFDKLAFHDGLEQQLSELIADESASYSLSDCRGGIIFATRFKPPGPATGARPAEIGFSARVAKGRCSIPTPGTPTARPPWTGQRRPRTAGSWPSPSPKTAVKTARCISSKRTRPRIAGRHSRRSISDRRRQRGVERRRHRHFLHALSAARRAAGRRPAFLPANLVSQTRHPGQRRHL